MSHYINIDNEILNAINETCFKNSNVKSVLLFGSRARGDHNERSDIDLAINLANNTDLSILSELQDIDTLLKIDATVVDTKLDEKFLNNIEKEGILIYMCESENKFKNKPENKFENKFENLKKATYKLEVVCEKISDFVQEDILRDSLIQRFEICYELSWKTLKEYLIYNGISTQSVPRLVFKTSYQNNIINNEKVWLLMIQDRNISSHEYNENYSVEAAKRIKTLYLKEFNQIVQTLTL